MGRRPKSAAPVETAEKELLYSANDFVAVHESAQEDSFTIVQLKEDVESEKDQIEAFFFTRVKHNSFKGGNLGKLNASHILMLVPTNEISFPPKDVQPVISG
jgi:hypothetical protein